MLAYLNIFPVSTQAYIQGLDFDRISKSNVLNLNPVRIQPQRSNLFFKMNYQPHIQLDVKAGYGLIFNDNYPAKLTLAMQV